MLQNNDVMIGLIVVGYVALAGTVVWILISLANSDRRDEDR